MLSARLCGPRSSSYSLLVATGFAFMEHPTVGVQPDGSILTPVGQRLTPAGTQIQVDDRPLGMALSPNHQLLAVVTGSNFASRALHLIDVNTGTLKQTISINNSFVGVGFSPSGDKIYVGGGTNDVKVFSLTAGGTYAAAVPPTIPITPGSPAPSGLSVSPDGTRVYVALNQANAVAVIDTATSAIVTRVAVGTYPYTTVVSADGSKVYVTNWGGKIPTASDFTDGMNPVVVDRRTGIPVSGTVSVIDTASNSLLKTIDVGLHPTGMALSPSGDRVYVTNANSDTVSVIDTFTDTVVKTLSVGGGRIQDRAAAARRLAECSGGEPGRTDVVRRQRVAERHRRRRRGRTCERCGSWADPNRLVPDRRGVECDRRRALHRQRLWIRVDRSSNPGRNGTQLYGSRRRRLHRRRPERQTAA